MRNVCVCPFVSNKLSPCLEQLLCCGRTQEVLVALSAVSRAGRRDALALSAVSLLPARGADTGTERSPSGSGDSGLPAILG